MSVQTGWNREKTRPLQHLSVREFFIAMRLKEADKAYNRNRRLQVIAERAEKKMHARG